MQDGQAVMIPALKLSAKFVIHAVGARWLDGTIGESQALEQCYESIFRIADPQRHQELGDTVDQYRNLSLSY